MKNLITFIVIISLSACGSGVSTKPDATKADSTICKDTIKPIKKDSVKVVKVDSIKKK